MTPDQKYPYQADFKPLKDSTGEYKLEDGTIIKGRIILADLHIIGEDATGPQFAFSTVAAQYPPYSPLRILAPISRTNLSTRLHVTSTSSLTHHPS